jgi:tRNA G10  N-methylase Trm11
MKYIFILGRDPELSVLEIESYLESRGYHHKILTDDGVRLVADIKGFKPQKAIKELGGTQKIAEIIDSIENIYTGKSNKIRYAVSNYTDEEDQELLQDLKYYFKSIKVKAGLKKSSLSPYLSPSEAQNVLEIILYQNIMAKTVAVFDPKEHKFRDTKRPEQRPLHTISIRLAKILINLAKAKPGETLLDPFCGIGTMLQEAILQDINAIGVEKDPKVTKQAKINLKWVEKHYKTSAKYEVYALDSRNLSRKVKTCDIVASEPFMGPFLHKLPTESEARKTIRQLRPLYEKVLQELKKVTKKRIVIIAPRFKTRNRKQIHLNLENTLSKLDLKAQKPIPYTASKSKMIRDIWIIDL